MDKVCRYLPNHLFYCLLLLLSFSSQANDDRALKGIEGVKVFAFISDDAKAAQISESKVITEVELLLRSYGIKVLNNKKKSKNTAGIYVSVNAHLEYNTNGKLNGYYSIVKLDVLEYVHLDRHIKNNKKEPYLSSVWNTEIYMSGDHEDLRKHNLETVNDVSKNFINKFLDQNQ